MNMTDRTPPLVQRLLASLLLGGTLALPSNIEAAPTAPKADVRGLLGRAQYSRAGAPMQPVTKGVAFEAGDVIQTASGAAIDIDFGGAAGIVRLTQMSTLVIEKWTAGDAGQELAVFLRDGEMLGRVSPSAGRSRFDLKVNSGIGSIMQGQFRLDAKGYLVLVEGKGAFIHVPASGEPAPHSLSAPPAVYFSPTEGVRPASADLVKEISGQWRSKLPKR